MLMGCCFLYMSVLSVCVHLHLHHFTCLMPSEASRMCQISWGQSYKHLWVLCGYWELNPSPLEGTAARALTNSEPLLQLQWTVFKYRVLLLSLLSNTPGKTWFESPSKIEWLLFILELFSSLVSSVTTLPPGCCVIVLLLYLLFSLAEMGLHVWNIFILPSLCLIVQWRVTTSLWPTMKAIVLTFTVTVVLCCICAFIIKKKIITLTGNIVDLFTALPNALSCWLFYNLTKCLLELKETVFVFTCSQPLAFMNLTINFALWDLSWDVFCNHYFCPIEFSKY